MSIQNVPTLHYTPIDEITSIRARLDAGHAGRKLLDVSYRKEQILQLAYLIQENIPRFVKAFQLDLGRPAQDAITMELGAVVRECVEAYKNVDKWAKPDYPPFSANFFAMKPIVYKQPKGVSLIIGPFNYPIWCSLTILAGAIAAGSPTVVKMSEQTPAVSSLVAELFPQYLDPDLFACINGGIPETKALLDMPWGHLVFTGSGTVGKVVATAAAKTLTPITLELGGQSPVIVDPRTNLKLAARRILWGKAANSGQTCIAPNHVLIPREGQAALVEALKEAYASFYPNGAAASDSFARMISDAAFQRMKDLFARTKGTIVVGGESDQKTKFIAPTVVQDVSMDDALMERELFGPVLAIIPVDDFDAAIKLINEKDHALTLYVFTDDPVLKKKVIENTTSGSINFNEVLIQGGVPGLPFGGVGGSGSGAHKGKFSFDTFTHLRSSIDNPAWVEMFLGWRYPPFSAKKFQQAERLQSTIPAPRPGTIAYTRAQSWKKSRWLFALLVLIPAVLFRSKALKI